MIRFFHQQSIEIAHSDLEMAYHDMELFAIEKDLPLNRNLKEFFQRQKFYAVNKSLVRWECLVALYDLTGEEQRLKNYKRWEEIKNDIPDDLLALSDKFALKMNHVVNLKRRSPITYFNVCSKYVSSLFKNGITGIRNVHNTVRSIAQIDLERVGMKQYFRAA